MLDILLLLLCVGVLGTAGFVPGPTLNTRVGDMNIPVAVPAVPTVSVTDMKGQVGGTGMPAGVASVVFGNGAKLGEEPNAAGKPLQLGLYVLAVGPEYIRAD